MPRILINEKDNTSSGASGSYENYSVLIVGYDKAITKEVTEEGRVTELTAMRKNINEYKEAVAKAAASSSAVEIPKLSDEEKMLMRRDDLVDTNGVYEFESAQDFEETIGLVEPSAENLYHYGNKMAYELLNMGYTIVYKSINSVSDIENENFWEPFKDKASYDFRFVTHGLLTTCSAKNDSEYDIVNNRKELVEAAIAALQELKKRVDQEANPEFEYADAYFEEGENGKPFHENYPGLFVEETEDYYSDYDAAVVGTEKELEDLNTKIANIEATYVDEVKFNKINTNIANLAMYKAAGTGKDTYNDFDTKEIPGRGDCIALIELDESEYVGSANPVVSIINAINKTSLAIDSANGKYCAMTVPSVYYKGNIKFPGAFHYLACFKNSLNLGFKEWYAAAGYTRGVSSYIVDHTTVKLGEVAINALEPRNYDDPQGDYPKFACNVIANFRGSYYLWGNRTAEPLGKKGNATNGDLIASSFLNIRQLCCTLKKQLYVSCRRFTFDPNSDTLWFNFVNAIRPTLEAMKADQGIRDYKILKVTDNPKKATLKAKIRIIPIEAVEDFDLEISLEDSFGETAAVVTE